MMNKEWLMTQHGSASAGKGTRNARTCRTNYWSFLKLKLCSQHMCCVEQDDEYSCKSDVTKDCAVYAGCVVLIDYE